MSTSTSHVVARTFIAGHIKFSVIDDAGSPHIDLAELCRWLDLPWAHAKRALSAGGLVATKRRRLVGTKLTDTITLEATHIKQWLDAVGHSPRGFTQQRLDLLRGRVDSVATELLLSHAQTHRQLGQLRKDPGSVPQEIRSALASRAAEARWERHRLNPPPAPTVRRYGHVGAQTLHELFATTQAGKSLTQAAKMAGISPATASLLKNRKYPGWTPEMDAAWLQTFGTGLS